MPWAKGQSGNATGRPKASAEQVKALARKHTPAAIRALVQALKAESERTRVAAAEALLNRAWGKPDQSVTVDATVRSDPAALSDAYLASIIAADSGEGTAEASDDKDRLH